MTRYAVGLGSNEGDRLEHLTGACQSLESEFGRLEISPLYETEPVGGPDQDPFLNAVVAFSSERSPIEILDALQAIEQAHGRQRTLRWGPRTLDLDIITSDGEPIANDRLEVPHARAAEREFVLRPLVDVWSDAPLGKAGTASDLLASVGDQGVHFLLARWYPAIPTGPTRALVAGQFALFIVAALALAYDGTLPEGEVTALRLVGASLAMAGLILAFISSRRLGPAMTANPMPRSGASLVIAGPYRYARHPIYGGVTLVLVGTALFLDSFFGLIAGITLFAYLWVKSGYEERLLRTAYAGYQRYRVVVSRRMIPFIV